MKFPVLTIIEMLSTYYVFPTITFIKWNSNHVTSHTLYLIYIIKWLFLTDILLIHFQYLLFKKIYKIDLKKKQTNFF